MSKKTDGLTEEEEQERQARKGTYIELKDPYETYKRPYGLLAKAGIATAGMRTGARREDLPCFSAEGFWADFFEGFASFARAPSFFLRGLRCFLFSSLCCSKILSFCAAPYKHAGYAAHILFFYVEFCRAL